jgi:hypothetical protein
MVPPALPGPETGLLSLVHAEMNRSGVTTRTLRKVFITHSIVVVPPQSGGQLALCTIIQAPTKHKPLSSRCESRGFVPAFHGLTGFSEGDECARTYGSVCSIATCAGVNKTAARGGEKEFCHGATSADMSHPSYVIVTNGNAQSEELPFDRASSCDLPSCPNVSC